MAGKRRFGRVRKLPSGRWQARYPGPDGVDRPAPETFARKSDAERFLALVEAQLVSRSWRDPEAGRIPLAEYAEKWIKERGLRPRTVELYRWLLGRYITPRLGRVNLVDLDTPMIREWRAEVLDSGVSPVMAAKAYRLLRAVLMTAAGTTRSFRATRAGCGAPTGSSPPSGQCSRRRRSSRLPIGCRPG